MTTVDLDTINQDAPPFGRFEHVQTARFGPHLEAECYRMSNGLRVLLVEDRTAPVVAYHTWFRVGSRNEREGKTGLAHLFEHLMFNETEHLPKGDFDRRLEEAGAESNASTWLDFTQYNISAPKERLQLLIEIEADRMQHLVLRPPQVESEKEVVANERRYRVDDDVEGSVSELLWSTAFVVHPYRWPTIGWMQDIESFDTEDCEAFYRAYYAPNNAIIVLVGDFEPEVALRLLAKHYGATQSSTLPDHVIPAEPPQTAERRVEVYKPTLTDKVSIGYRSLPFSHPDHVTLTLLGEVLTGGRASRLHRRLVRQREIASEVRAFAGPFRDPGLFELYASAREGHTAEELLSAIDEQLAELTRDGVTRAEVDRARARFELGFLHGLETADGKAHTIGFHDCILGRPNAAFERIESLAQVTPADVHRVACDVLAKERRSIIVVRVGTTTNQSASS